MASYGGGIMKKKILVKAPLLTRSGYGEQGRFAVRSLRSREDLFDIYIHPLNWGHTSWDVADTEERAWIDHNIQKTIAYMQQGGQYDISLQVTIPNEWERIAPVNIGYTAGIETNRVAGEWIMKAHEMDKMIVVSEHSKNVFKDTVHSGVDTRTNEKVFLQLNSDYDITTVGYPVKTYENLPKLDLDVTTKFNFLCVAQWGPRKNLLNTIRWFVEEFHDNADVGLIIKTNYAKNCLMDRNRMRREFENLLTKHHPDRNCKIYLLHGDMTDEEMHALYRHNKVDAFYMLPHGEGFGLPIFEAAYSALPVVTVGWSGQLDYLTDEKGNTHFYNVGYDIQTIPAEVVWQGVLIEDSMWANARERSAKKQLRQCYEDFSGPDMKKHKAATKKYAKALSQRFSEEKLYEQFVSHIYEPDEEVEEWLSELEEMVNV